jgi:hypothetical protein
LRDAKILILDEPTSALDPETEEFLVQSHRGGGGSASGGQSPLSTQRAARCMSPVFFGRFFAQQFKRTTLPPGPKVGTVSLSPRGDWRMPDEASAGAPMAAIDEIELN